MEKVIRNVADIETADRQALEHLIGKHLADHEQVIISIVNLDRAGPDEPAAAAPQAVPAWWNIYEGLNDEQVECLDQAIRQRANFTRVFE